MLFWFPAISPADARADARETIDSLDRGFGYTIGDLVRRQITIRGDATRFSRDLLPEPGRITAWLALVGVDSGQTGDDVLLTLTYQITGADTRVALLELPVVELKIQNQTLARIDARPISVSPIIGPKPFIRSGLGELQADRQPLAPDFQSIKRRFLAFAVATLALLAMLGWRSWRRTQSDRIEPFALARRALRAESNPIQGYRILHRAFDQTAERSLFLEDLTQFLIEQPAYNSARESIEHFFGQSRLVFFNTASATNDRESLKQVRALANRLAKLEAKVS